MAWSTGFVQPASSPRLAGAPWPDVPRTLAPAGFVPSPIDASAASPICSPGFAVLLAPFVWAFGQDGLFAVTPLAGALLVWCVFLIGRHLRDDWAGAAAALLVATSPIVLFQVVQPMNDIVVAALWLGVVVLLGRPAGARVFAAGLAAGLALLVRPNLLPVGAIAGAWVLVDGTGASNRWRAAASFAAGVAPFGVVLLGLHARLYGSALSTGYGDAQDLFTLASIPANASLRFSALVSTHSVFPFLGVLAPLVLRRTASVRRLTRLALAIAAGVLACYLPYRPFPEWWYLRFLIPALALLVVLATAVLVEALSRPNAASARRAAVVLMVAWVAALAAFQVSAAAGRQAFALQRIEGRFRLAALAVRDRVSADAAVLTVWESGSVRFHADRDVLMWDSLDTQWLDRAVAWLTSQGAAPVILVERWEEPLFRARFAGQSFGALDWPPRFDVDSTVRAFVTTDRESYLAGRPVPTEIIVAR
jgi:4-amino-4-deoxy-L-arabinose transferase-like glycosyltransferase